MTHDLDTIQAALEGCKVHDSDEIFAEWHQSFDKKLVAEALTLVKKMRDNESALATALTALDEADTSYDNAHAEIARLKAEIKKMRDGSALNIGGVDEIKPCPYVNGYTSDNAGMSYILTSYKEYSDFVLFDDGKPARCFRFVPKPPVSGGDDE